MTITQRRILRNLMFFSALTLAVGCTKLFTRQIYIAFEDQYEIRKGNFAGNSEMKEVKFANGKLREQGHVAYDKEGNLSNLKIGEWTSYYENGQLKSKGQYSIGSFIECCFSGPCKQFYNYKTDNWEYFYPSGQLKATGEYQSKQMHVRTNCEGGDNMPFGITTSLWRYFNEAGELIELSEQLRIELETVETGDRTLASHFFPDSKKENIKRKYNN